MLLHLYIQQHEDLCKWFMKTSAGFLPPGICSAISVRHEGERPVQKYGL